jgi:hypothetical protein
MKKDEQIAISITGLSQETASGFSGNCGVFTSAGKSTYMSLSFRNDYVSTQVFGFNTGGNYFLNCTNLSTKEVAKIVISAVSFESITNPNNGNITIPGMESVLVSLKVKKDIPWFLTILGSGKTTASGFRGDCTVFDNSGKYTYLNLAFSNDFGSSIRSLPTYSGNVVLFCTNNSKEKAVLNFGMYSTASIRSETISTISIAPIDFAVLRFTTQKSQPISMSTKGNPKKTTSGFYGDCSIYDENGGFSYSSFNFDADRVIANVFTPSYSGFYYLQCYNRGTEAAIFEIFGYTPNNSTFVSNLSIKTEITNDIATMITVGAQANGQAVGEDATAFSKWNKGLIDRIIPEKNDKKKSVEEEKPEEEKPDYEDTIEEYEDFVKSMSTQKFTDSIDSFQSVLKNFLT